jgi:hypothetical protein
VRQCVDEGGVTRNSSVQIVFSKPQRRHATMRKVTVVELRWPGQDGDLLSTMLREGAQRLPAQAVRSAFEEFLARFAAQRDACGRAAVVRNGHQPERGVLTGLGPVAVTSLQTWDENPLHASSLYVPNHRRERAPRIDSGVQKGLRPGFFDVITSSVYG